ncbi:class I SAM-dependent methyltransferase [Blastochloris viridis]|uniref:Methyltransferase n=1 Tax=Blastochloris viridis TaxID=1079 RepID=A0A0H5BNY6_BLAVI|nr:dTDP-3-amino-3,6-dideoxy-alpha-D-glucopyranose N,N-dimethyltransferase [Blastochloris viridis]BAR98453.1 methyltransferase [Blastochloris viridis]CUU44202.1 Mg-protoporphyrin IX methyl transferase [Blastochloris viridis]
MATDAERIIGLYRRHARAWADRRAARAGPLMEAAWLERFCALLPPAAAVLDIGCGSGEPIGRELVERGCALTGIDSSPEMIAMCAQRQPRQTWRVADMRTLALGRAFAGIIAWDSMFHLSHDDQRRMFPIFRRHAAPRAALMFTSGPAHGEATGTFEGEPLYHASLDAAEYRALLADHGFAVVAHVAEDPGCGGHTVWLAQRRDGVLGDAGAGQPHAASSGGSLPPFAASLAMTCLCSQTFIFPESPLSPS